MEKKFSDIDSSILYRCSQKYYDKVLTKYNLGYTHLLFLLKIYENEGLTMNELASFGSFDKGTITKSLKVLEQFAYVDIKYNEKDKRSRCLYTTDKANKIIPELYILRQQWQEYLYKDISGEDLIVFDRVMNSVINKAREYELFKQVNDVKIYGLQKLTLLDYPGKMACTVFTGGCNFRCPYCHNRSLVFLNEQDGEFLKEDIFNYLDQRKGILDGVCISGGEPLLQDGLKDFVREIKEYGLLVKLDTNGSNYLKLKELIDLGLVDYVAMDIKNTKDKYGLTIGLSEFDIREISKSVELLKSDVVEYEFRTTLVKEFHDDLDVSSLGRWLRGCKNFYLQNFEDKGSCIESGLHALDKEKIFEYKNELEKYIDNVEIRGIRED